MTTCGARLTFDRSCRERGQGNINFPCSADHEQGWQPYLVDPYSAICDDHTWLIRCVTVVSSVIRTIYAEERIKKSVFVW